MILKCLSNYAQVGRAQANLRIRLIKRMMPRRMVSDRSLFFYYFFLNFQKTRGSKDEDLMAQGKSLREKDKKSRDLILSLGKKEKEALNIFFI
jgi:hypothetical protein